MGTTLTGTTPQDTYDSLIKVTDNGPIGATAKYLSDGLGNDSKLALSTGNVGINITAPKNQLHVNGSMQVGFVDASNDAMVFSWGGASTNGTIQTFSSSVLALNPAGNNVGIGTTAPAAKLEVSSTDLSSIFVTNPTTSGATTGSGIGFKAYNGTSVAQYGSIVLTSNTWSFGTYSPQQLSIGSDGTGGLALRSTLSAPITFHTGGTFSGEAVERVRISSNGLSFNGDTAAANALDDYEEGTWTMGVAFGGASVGVTTLINTGTYTKIGRQVTVNGILVLTRKGSSTGAARVTGLPFTIANNDANYCASTLRFTNVTFANQFQGFGSINTTTIELNEITVLGAVTNLTDADFANNSDIMVSLTYFV
jgi:hypothetical protein